MNNEEAIKRIREHMIIHAEKEPRAIYITEALQMAIKALGKDIPKEPVQTHTRYGHGNEYNDYYCPNCDGFLAYEPQGNGYKRESGWSRCTNCGQKIIWEEKQDV